MNSVGNGIDMDNIILLDGENTSSDASLDICVYIYIYIYIYVYICICIYIYIYNSLPRLKVEISFGAHQYFII